MALLPFVAAYTKASGSQQVKATGLTVTCSVYKVVLATGVITRLINAAAATELSATGTTGSYFYIYSGALDFTAEFYFAEFTTADGTVQQVDIAAAWFDYPASIAKTAAGEVTVGSLISDALSQIADAYLARNAAGGSDGGKTVAYYTQGGPPRVAFDVPSVGHYTVYGADGTTIIGTGTYASAAVDPVTTMTPA